jgi:hypothetical protein
LSVLKKYSKFYNSKGNIAKLRRTTWLPKNGGGGEREIVRNRERRRERAENKNPGHNLYC